MAHFNFAISQNAKWGHAGFYIDCHRMTVPENILSPKKHCSQEYCKIMYDHYLRRFYDFASELYPRKALHPL